ncbi:hypothetical protein ACFVWN_23630 [Nocardiopsis flavescens]|uniref:Uncharacterized protein n=1 Tax=Nocardiopsis flavescens TaxID=758803 RepID=A0A1M6RS35_9ACTN|nr:hypothetical protein [Nocardiopsis flavescens]SHK35220.1 hypothetical protein SAMN05421803_11845 [Nocardiopsis flavescens]
MIPAHQYPVPTTTRRARTEAFSDASRSREGGIDAAALREALAAAAEHLRRWRGETGDGRAQALEDAALMGAVNAAVVAYEDARVSALLAVDAMP